MLYIVFYTRNHYSIQAHEQRGVFVCTIFILLYVHTHTYLERVQITTSEKNIKHNRTHFPNNTILFSTTLQKYNK
jgi:hypothetical protein